MSEGLFDEPAVIRRVVPMRALLAADRYARPQQAGFRAPAAA
ncbi:MULTISPECIES: hypothetical protein [Parafrankia]|nr:MULTISPECIES: hypothetical protein [Parafrankia]